MLCCNCNGPYSEPTGHVLSRPGKDLMVLCGMCARNFLAFWKKEGINARRRGHNFAKAAATSVKAP